MRSLRTTVSVVAVATLTATGIGMTSAHASANVDGNSVDSRTTDSRTTDSRTSTKAPTVGTHIVGGVKANVSYYVQLSYTRGAKKYVCTGQAISKDWVLTARHCITGISGMDVYYSNDKVDRGPAHPADRWESSSATGDVALVHLKDSKSLSSYAPLADSYTASSSDTGTIYGYGRRANGAKADWLYKAEVKVTGSSADYHGGRSIRVKGSTGSTNFGDSGGPLVVDGKVVGICSTVDKDPGASKTGMADYANITKHRAWITDTAGV